MTTAEIGLIVTVSLAVIGYLYKYFDDRRIRRRKDRLELVNKQIEEFYGPLFFRVEAGERAFHALKQKLGKNIGNSMTPAEFAEWRAWVTHIFHPNNLETEKVIIEKSYLILDDKTPECLVDFVAHISGYKIIMEKWKNNDFSEHFSVINYPRGIKEYIQHSHQELKKRQSELIAK